MNKLKTKEKEKVKQFITFTQASERVAIQALTAANWSVESAAALFFDNPDVYSQPASGSSASSVDRKKIDALFVRYRDRNNESLITLAGVEALLHDLNLTPDNRLVLIFAWKCEAVEQCAFTRDEFAKGLTALKADTIEKLHQRLVDADNELRQDPKKFRDFYQFTFVYAKNPSQKGLGSCLQSLFSLEELMCRIGHRHHLLANRARESVSIPAGLVRVLETEPQESHTERHVESTARFFESSH